MENYENDVEEPLFADDLDDDPPPLPPPLDLPTDTPSFFSQIRREAGDLRVGLEDAAATQTNSETGGHGRRRQRDQRQEDGQGDVHRSKRKPLLKLSVDRLFSDGGLPYLANEFPKLKFKGKGNEEADLKHLLKQYELWANALFPKFTFRNFTDRVEAMGSKNAAFKAEFSRMRRRSAGLPDFPSLATVADEEEEEDRDDGCNDIDGHPAPSLTDSSETAPGIGSPQMRNHSHSNGADDTLALDNDKENELPGPECESRQGIDVNPTGPAGQHSDIHSQGEDGLAAAQSLYCDGSPNWTGASESGSPCNENMTGSDEPPPVSVITQGGRGEEEDATAPSVVADSSLRTSDYDGSISNDYVNETATFLAREDVTTGSGNVDAERGVTHTDATDRESGRGLNCEGTSDRGAESNNDGSMAEAAAAVGCDFDLSQNGGRGLLVDNADLADMVVDQIQDSGDTDT